MEENQYDGQELPAATCFKKDTTLWVPGHGGKSGNCAFGSGCCPLPSTPENSDNDMEEEAAQEEEGAQGRQCTPAAQQDTQQQSKRSKQRQAAAIGSVRRLR